MSVFSQRIYFFLNKFYDLDPEFDNGLSIEEIITNLNEFFHLQGIKICNYACFIDDIKNSSKYSNLIISDDMLFGLRLKDCKKCDE